MKALLMHRDRDSAPEEGATWNESALIQDLELRSIIAAMGNGDEYLLDVAHKTLLSSLENDLETVLYRQAALRDAIKNPQIIRDLYGLAVEAIEEKRNQWLGIYTHNPSGILTSALRLMQLFMGILKKLRDIAQENAERFESEAFQALFTTLKTELNDEYLATVQDQLQELQFRGGVLVSAELGRGNEGRNYVLRKPQEGSWVRQLVRKRSRSYSFSIHPRDMAGGIALAELRNRGVHLAANALAQSTDHILSFFQMLRMELAFYVGSLNLYERLRKKGEPVCFPRPLPPEERILHFSGLYDLSLSLHVEGRVVGNTVNADGKSLVMITGANQGGKSTFLRSIGIAQLMMQAGMFVGAESFAGAICTGIFTHYKREEDKAMRSGKFDEEIARMSEIADVIRPNAMILFNESFAATNEREGSEIARQAVTALLERGIKVFFVTHMYELARSLLGRDDALYLRAERLPDGTRTFKLIPAEPSETSYGEDLYREIFAAGGKTRLTSPQPEQGG